MTLACRIVNGTFFCEKLSLQEIIEACKVKLKVLPTPLFVYSKAQIVNNIHAYQDALELLDCESQINYAVKANPNLSLLRLIRSLGASATLISGNEIKLALESGFEPTSMMYNGGGKCYWETRLAIEHNLLINVDSLWDLKQTLEICKNGFSEPKTARLLLRINLNIDSSVHKFVNTGKADSKFGLFEDELEACLKLLEQPSCSAELVGLHSHLGSTIYQSDVFRLSLERLLEYHAKLTRRGFTKVSLINIGGGLGIDYRLMEFETKCWQSESEENQKNIQEFKEYLMNLEDDKSDVSSRDSLLSSLSAYMNESISFEDLRLATAVFLSTNKHLGSRVEELCSILTVPKQVHATPLDLIQSVSDLLKGNGLKLIIEPGRSLVANSCIVISKILGCKQSSEKRFIIVDASMTEIIRPCLYGAYHHVTVLDNSENSSNMKKEKKVCNVVGPVCESSDFLAQNRMLPAISDGYAIIHDVGAYCYSMASNYNVRMRPAEVLVDDRDCSLIRRPDTYEDFMAPYREI